MPSAEQIKELPEPSPPNNLSLASALRGTFSGYLHNETTDTYQVVRLNVLPYSSTDNPHNPNQMRIIATAAIHLGRGINGNFITQRYESRSFYVRPGFTLLGPRSDSYVNIQEWKQGFIRGVWYSHAFGRVGTVQLVKSELTPISDGANVLRSFAGEFEGLVAPNGQNKDVRWLKLLFPSSADDLINNVIRFTGSYQSIVGVTGVKDIERGTFDPYTGALGWIMSNGEEAATFSSGNIGPDNNAKLYWPPVPEVFGAITNDYQLQSFDRIDR